MTLEPFPSAFPYIRGKFNLIFISVLCTALTVCRVEFNAELPLGLVLQGAGHLLPGYVIK
jgi:hypothetical protein